jgi:hypothetical protein
VSCSTTASCLSLCNWFTCIWLVSMAA